jgi:hypothetical protein
MASKPEAKAKVEKAKVGDEVRLEGSALVVLPGGSVVSTYMRYRFALPGRHVVGGVDYEVTE